MRSLRCDVVVPAALVQVGRAVRDVCARLSPPLAIKCEPTRNILRRRLTVFRGELLPSLERLRLALAIRVFRPPRLELVRVPVALARRFGGFRDKGFRIQ